METGAEKYTLRSVETEVFRVGASGDCTQEDVRRILTAAVQAIQDAIRGGELVEIQGLGKFERRDLKPRKRISLRSGRIITVKSRTRVVFTPSRYLTEL